jgi:nitrite reductase/ring-hydroxylating ferredoxin subunit
MGKRLICASSDVIERGKGVRFTIQRDGQCINAFVIRYRGTAHGYLNRCAHISVELDWGEGQFFDFSSTSLICATHGALYQPESGRCVGGPCLGRGLSKLAIEETDGKLYLIESLTTNQLAMDEHG